MTLLFKVLLQVGIRLITSNYQSFESTSTFETYTVEEVKIPFQSRELNQEFSFSSSIFSFIHFNAVHHNNIYSNFHSETTKRSWSLKHQNFHFNQRYLFLLIKTLII